VARPSPFTFLLLSIAAVWLWVAWLIWQNDTLSERITAGDLEIDGPQALLSLPPLVTGPLRQVLFQGSQTVDADNAFLATVADEYIRRRPLNSDGWLLASQFRQRNHETELAAAYLGTAHLLSRTNSPILMKVFNRYLALGLIDQAMPVAKDLVFAKPDSFRKLFYLLTRLNTDYPAVVEQVIPSKVPTHREYQPAIYYSWALNDAVRAKNDKLAEAVWAATPAPLKLDSAFGLNYLNYLVSLQDWQKVQPVWQGLTGETIEFGQVARADFELPLDANSPCWQAKETAGASWALDDYAYQGKQSLKVEFDGEENPYYAHLSCFVPVQPGATYTLTGRWAGEGISTLSGPFLDVYAPGVKGFYKRNQAMLGNWPWAEFEVGFTVPEGAEVISVRVRRNKTDAFDSKISGRVWFDDFELVEKEQGIEGEIPEEPVDKEAI
jgi:hypothetical protein